MCDGPLDRIAAWAGKVYNETIGTTHSGWRVPERVGGAGNDAKQAYHLGVRVLWKAIRCIRVAGRPVQVLQQGMQGDGTQKPRRLSLRHMWEDL